MRSARRLSIAAPAALALLSFGCAAMQAQSDAVARENRDMRRLLMETREELAAVKRDQERLRATVEYLQHATGGRMPPPRPDGYAPGREPMARGGSGWPDDPWRGSGSDDVPGSASAYDSALGDSAGPLPPADEPRSRDDLAGELGSRAGAAASAGGVESFAAEESRDAWQGGAPPPPPPAGFPGTRDAGMGGRDARELASAGGNAPPPAAAGPGLGATTPPPTVPSSLRGTGYDDGVRSFLDGQYDDAIQYFRDFVYQNASSSYADDAQYWIGEAYLRKGLYSNAIKEFNQVVLRYGSSDRSAGALLKLADVFMKIGDNVDARLSLQKLVSRYPRSSEAGEAQKMLAEMGG